MSTNLTPNTSNRKKKNETIIEYCVKQMQSITFWNVLNAMKWKIQRIYTFTKQTKIVFPSLLLCYSSAEIFIAIDIDDFAK